MFIEQPFDRPRAVCVDALIDFALLFCDMNVYRDVVFGGTGGDFRQRLFRYRTQARRLCAPMPTANRSPAMSFTRS
jgi:hypothetical protein